MTWNEAKRVANLHRHGVDFAGLGDFFDGNLLTEEDARSNYGEVRLRSLGMVQGVVLFVVWTPRGAADDVAHIISARKATKHEAEIWYERCSENLRS